MVRDRGLEDLIEEKVSPNLHHVRLGPDFLNKTPKAQEEKSRINKWVGFKLKKNFFLSKGNYQEHKKRAYRMGANFYYTHISRALISRIYKELKKQITQSINGLRN